MARQIRDEPMARGESRRLGHSRNCKNCTLVRTTTCHSVACPHRDRNNDASHVILWLVRTVTVRMRRHVSSHSALFAPWLCGQKCFFFTIATVRTSFSLIPLQVTLPAQAGFLGTFLSVSRWLIETDAFSLRFSARCHIATTLRIPLDAKMARTETAFDKQTHRETKEVSKCRRHRY